MALNYPKSPPFYPSEPAPALETNEEYLNDNNLGYTRELCEWSQNDVRFVYASSASTYGDGSLGMDDQDEDLAKFEPLNLYGWSKHKFDLLAQKNGWLDQIVGLKYFNVYGPNEEHKGDMRSVVSKAYEQIASTGEMTLFKSPPRLSARGTDA